MPGRFASSAAAGGSFPGELIGYFGLAIAVTGAAALMTYYLGADLWLWWRARNWPSVPCTVTSLDPVFRYRYQVGKRTYESGRNGIGSIALPDPLPAVGSQRNCFYDPGIPSEALLDRNYGGWWWLPGAWLLASFLLHSTGPSLVVALWRWATFRPDPPLTWAQWFATFYQDGAWMFSVVGLTALLPGLAMTWFMTALPWWHWWQVTQWAPTPCEMVTSEVRGWSGGSGASRSGGYILDIRFRYRFRDRTLSSTTYSPWRLGGTEWLLQSSTAEGIAALQSRFAPGTKHTCFVSPDDPTQAYLSKERAGYATYVSCIGPFLTLLGWILLCARR